MDIDAFRGPSLKRLTPQEREQLRRKNACFRCCQIGHISRNCPLGQQHPRFQNGLAVMNTEWQQSPFTGSQAPIGYPYFYPNAPYGIYPPPMHMVPFASAPQAQTNAQPLQQHQQQQQSSQDFPQRHEMNADQFSQFMARATALPEQNQALKFTDFKGIVGNLATVDAQ
ncbi:hypothetical protein COEREDRAFT_12548 [Coemansia reversa NRRL 1564]|uniref:CCHC-type domain-containing protein n=1 Tax=Coemansia reversa (strain ATCC 12441 / NRRL 1564) TaxID=763665 RepID=A0A2G5B0P9_COERN|nr:hypothetical protein COEREDRAFT_12548 [Coemansia reversa NRRL 1564]|eukprot:PIA12593.1 hypothetical protein COEREDRAFT_12548 [Coemansia reversa NRRL 1564]